MLVKGPHQANRDNLEDETETKYIHANFDTNYQGMKKKTSCPQVP